MTRNPFKGYQEGRQGVREELLTDYLAFLDKSRLRPKHPTQLAEMCAQYLTDKQGKNCSASTLLRNVRYKGQLLTYMADHQEGGTKAAKLRKLSDPAAKVALLKADLTISNLRAEVERLKGYVGQLEEESADRGKSWKGATAAQPVASSLQISAESLNYVAVCRALHLVIERLGGIILVDAAKQEILDASTFPPSVVVCGEAVELYLNWLSKQSSLGGRHGRQ